MKATAEFKLRRLETEHKEPDFNRTFFNIQPNIYIFVSLTANLLQCNIKLNTFFELSLVFTKYFITSGYSNATIIWYEY